MSANETGSHSTRDPILRVPKGEEKRLESLQKTQNGNPKDDKIGATNLIGFYALCRSCRCTFRRCVKEQSVRLKPDGSKALVGRVKCPECGSNETEVQDFRGD